MLKVVLQEWDKPTVARQEEEQSLRIHESPEDGGHAAEIAYSACQAVGPSSTSCRT